MASQPLFKGLRSIFTLYYTPYSLSRPSEINDVLITKQDPVAVVSCSVGDTTKDTLPLTPRQFFLI